MPHAKPAGIPGENTDTALGLSREIEATGLSPTPFPQFHFPPGSAKRRAEPDLEIVNGGHHFVSAKKGENQFPAAFATAVDYALTVPHAVELKGKRVGEFFAVTYPKAPEEKFHVMVVTRFGHHGPLTFSPLDSVGEVARLIKSVIDGQFDEYSRSLEPAGAAARRLLYWGAESLGRAIRHVSDEELESIFGGRDFFRSVLSTSLKGEKRQEALRIGPAFLFVNQVFFYMLLSQANTKAGRKQYPPIADADRQFPSKLDELYFSRVRDIDYKPIYGIHVAHFFSGKEATEACGDIIGALDGLVPALDTSDLSGQVFQALIPLGIRKPLGAHYTNPNAAALLASLAVEEPRSVVFDPACGSGTLLVAAYRRKMLLAGGAASKRLHKPFVEEELFGVDAMAFSGHLAAVNLALQRPLEETDSVRIGTADSTLLRPNGEPIGATDSVVPTALRQRRLDDVARQTSPKARSRGAVGLKDHGDASQGSFSIPEVDNILMNPPFTSWENMDTGYRSALRLHFKNVSKRYFPLITFRPSQQLFFLLLADRFLKKGGTMAAVLPLTTFTGKSFLSFTEWFIKNYQVRYMILGLGRASFSEDTALTECMVVATKSPPVPGHKITIIGVENPPETWTEDGLKQLLSIAVDGRAGSNEEARVLTVPQGRLSPASDSLGGIYLGLDPAYRIAQSAFKTFMTKSSSLVSWATAESRYGVSISGGLRSGEHLSYYGPKGLIVLRNRPRKRLRDDRLVLSGYSGSALRSADLTTGETFDYPLQATGRAIRKFSYLPSLDVSDSADFYFRKYLPELETIFRRYYSESDTKKFLSRIRETTSDRPGGRWQGRASESSSSLVLVRRIDFGAPGSTVLCTWSHEPVFVACEAYGVSNVPDEYQQKLLALWFNSTFFLLEVVAHATITRGTWMKIEEFSLAACDIPALHLLSPAEKKIVDSTWSSITGTPWPALMDQLLSSEGPRVELDDAVLKLLGCLDQSERRSLAEKVRAGVHSALIGLARTMGAGVSDEDDEPAE